MTEPITPTMLRDLADGLIRGGLSDCDMLKLEIVSGDYQITVRNFNDNEFSQTISGGAWASGHPNYFAYVGEQIAQTLSE